jgi:hypothetical protein
MRTVPAAIPTAVSRIPENCCEIMTRIEITGMTFGRGNYYTFEPGTRYTVPDELADHLESRGYLTWRG